MDRSDVRHLAPPAPVGTRFDMAQGVVFMEDHSLEFRGFGGSRCLSLGRGWDYDLTGGVGGAEQLRLCGESANYRVAMDADMLMLAHPVDGTTVRLRAGRGPHCLVFDDGWVQAGDLWRNLTQAAALMRLAGATGFTETVPLTRHVHPGSHAALGLGVQELPGGAVLQACNLDRLETVYDPEAVSRAFLDGEFADYVVSLQGSVVCLDRRQRGRLESVYLVDVSQLSFVDGEVSVETLRSTLHPSGGSSIPPLCDEKPRAITVALAMESMTAACSTSWFTGLSNGAMLSGLSVGQVIETTVTFDMAVFVGDAPQVRLRVGNLRRRARYSGGGGSDTLRFSYVVTDDDVLELSMDATQAGTLALDWLRLDVEVSDVVSDGNQIGPLSSFMRYSGSERMRPCPDGPWRDQTRPGIQVDVNLEDLEQSSCV